MTTICRALTSLRLPRRSGSRSVIPGALVRTDCARGDREQLLAALPAMFERLAGGRAWCGSV
jgi:hypothetical protein